jgi:putative salt-induced outer membrane protein YdiY
MTNNQPRRRLKLALVGAIAAMTPLAASDVVTLQDGSRLVGDVRILDGDTFVIITQFAGTLEIEAALIESISTEAPVNVETDTGDRFVGPLTWTPGATDASITTEYGLMTIPSEQISAIWPEDAKSPDERRADEAIQKLEEEYAAKLPDWKFSIEAGAVYKEGNTETFDARGRIQLERTTDKDLLRFYLTGEYGEDNKVRDTSEVKLGAYYEYLFTERLYAYGRGSLEYDEFEDLELRATIAGGPGYYLIKEDWHELKARGGLGFQHESYLSGGEDSNSAFIDLGYNYRLDIDPYAQFTHSGTYEPTFEGLDDYRLEFDTALVFPLASSENVSLKIGVTHEYDAMPEPGVERLDTTYYGNILITLD